METLGSLGPKSLCNMDFLMNLAGEWGKSHGIRNWRTSLEMVVLWELADAAMVSAGKCASRDWLGS
eukprot:6762629-Karenia_brevis.AAC.1